MIGDRDYFKRFFSRTADKIAEIRAELLEMATLYDKDDGARLSLMVDGHVTQIRDAVSQLSLSVHEVHEEALDRSSPRPPH